MKLNLAIITALSLLMSMTITASEISAPEEIQLLRREIQIQESVMVAMKERLQSLEKNK